MELSNWIILIRCMGITCSLRPQRGREQGGNQHLGGTTERLLVQRTSGPSSANVNCIGNSMLSLDMLLRLAAVIASCGEPAVLFPLLWLPPGAPSAITIEKRHRWTQSTIHFSPTQLGAFKETFQLRCRCPRMILGVLVFLKCLVVKRRSLRAARFGKLSLGG